MRPVKLYSVNADPQRDFKLVTGFWILDTGFRISEILYRASSIKYPASALIII